MEELSVLLLTFNCGREFSKPEVFAAHIVNALPKVPPEIVVLSLQEVAPIAYSFLGGSFLEPYLARFRQAIDVAASSWSEHGKHHFVTLASRNVGMTAILVFARDDVAHRVKAIQAAGVGVGWYGTGNKGCVGVRLGFKTSNGIMDLTFLAAHLAPMEDGLERRNEDWGNIVRGLVFTSAPADMKARTTRAGLGDTGEEQPLLQGDNEDELDRLSGIYTRPSHVFIAGDLNYRTSNIKPSQSDISLYPQPVEPSHQNHFKTLLQRDQLSAEIRKNTTLQGFREFPIEFPPTYKYSDLARSAVASQEIHITGDSSVSDGEPSHWAWSSHRWPSWCDRILYLHIPNIDPSLGIKSHKYTSLPLMSTSDHQPVALSFNLPSIPVSLHDGSVSERGRIDPPYQIALDWSERRAMARRYEIVIGIGSYLALTWEGNGILLALVVGSLGGWAIVGSMIME